MLASAGCWGSVSSVLGGLYPSIMCIVLGPWDPNTSLTNHVRVCPPLLSFLLLGRLERV